MILGSPAKGVRVPAEQAGRVAQKVSDLLSGTATAILAGSMRRRRPEVADVEFVVLPERSLEALVKVLEQAGFSGGQKQRIYRKVIDDIPVEIYVAHKPAELGSMLLMYTGDALFNVALRSKAKRMGYKLDQYGIWKSGKLVFQSPDEREFFDFLGTPWHWPEDRSLARRQELKKMASRLAKESMEPGMHRVVSRVLDAVKAKTAPRLDDEQVVETMYRSRFGSLPQLKGASLGAEELIELGIISNDDGNESNGTMDIPFEDGEGLWQILYEQATGHYGELMGLSVFVIGDQIQIWAEAEEEGSRVFYVVYTAEASAEVLGRAPDEFLSEFVLWALETPEHQRWLGPFVTMPGLV